MKYQKIMALALSACMMLACTSALGEGIIGSISGVKEGGDIMAADQGRLAMEGDDNAQTDSTNQPDATNAPDATQPAYAIDENARRLYLKLKDEAPIQEGWQIQFAGDSTLMMLAAPDLAVWDIKPESGIMELKWARDLSDFLPEGEGGINAAISPDGERALLSASDGAVYLISANSTAQAAPAGASPTRLIWARDSLSYAYVNADGVNVTLSSGVTLLIDGDVILPVNNDMEWLNPGSTPEALNELLSSDEWKYAGTGESCVLFDSVSGDASCAYMLDTGAVVNYPEQVFSSMTIGRSGACPLYDANSKRYRLYLSDGSYADIPMLEAINGGNMANPYGWLGDSVCVLEQDFSSRSTFRLHAANTSTGITYTLLAPWEYAEMVNGFPVE